MPARPLSDSNRRARRGPLLPLLTAAILLTPAPGTAQVVDGRLLDSGSGDGVEGALVSLVSVGEQSDRVASVLTDSTGTFTLRAPEPGSYRLRAQRIGYRTARSSPLRLTTGDTLTHRMEAHFEPIALTGIDVRGERRCRVNPEEGALTARIWNEARKALEVARWTEEEGELTFETEVYTRRLDVDGERVREEDADTRLVVGRHPFRSMAPEILASMGYVQERDGERHYYGPDARTLLSDVFLSTHCFEVVSEGGDAERRRVGLAFRPLSGRETPEIGGVLWLDARTGELERVEFDYRNLSRDFPTDALGGEVVFDHTAAGAWFVREWSLRMPVAGLPLRDTDPDEPPELVLAGLQEVGGAVLSVSPRDGTGR